MAIEYKTRTQLVVEILREKYKHIDIFQIVKYRRPTLIFDRALDSYSLKAIISELEFSPFHWRLSTVLLQLLPVGHGPEIAQDYSLTSHVSLI